MRVTLAFLCAVVATPAAAQSFTYPAAFKTQEIEANGTTIHVRTAGSGPAVVLLHGYGETGDMWVPLAIELAKNHTVIVPDLRGMGLSSHPAGGFEKKNQAADLAGVLDRLRVTDIDLVAHDIGNMVAFAYAEQHGGSVKRLVLIDAPVPGIGPWEEILKNPLLWHFRFGGPDMERLVAGRERGLEFRSEVYALRRFAEYAGEVRLVVIPRLTHYGHIESYNERLANMMVTGFKEYFP